MTTLLSTYIPDILEEHLEELEFLWGQRQNALRDPDYTLKAFWDLEERIEAHLQGVLVPGDSPMPLLEEGLRAEDSLAVFAAAYSLLRKNAERATSLVLDHFPDSNGERLAGLREALSYAPADRTQKDIEPYQRSENVARAAAATEILAFHSALRDREDIKKFLGDPDANVRECGWRLVGYLGLSLDPKTHAAAMRDEEPAVRRAALQAGAWCGEPGILVLARKLAQEPNPDNLDVLEMLAVLGGPDDVNAMATIGRCVDLGPDRFRLVGAYGNPALMDLVLEGLADSDPAVAAAAGTAFMKLTGEDVESDNRVTVAPSDGSEPDEFEAEFLDEVFLPDPDKARAHWQKVASQLSHAQRICRGHDLAQRIEPEAFELVDMESRWEMFLRSRYGGAWTGSPLRLMVFPQKQ